MRGRQQTGETESLMDDEGGHAVVVVARETMTRRHRLRLMNQPEGLAPGTGVSPQRAGRGLDRSPGQETIGRNMPKVGVLAGPNTCPMCTLSTIGSSTSRWGPPVRLELRSTKRCGSPVLRNTRGRKTSKSSKTGFNHC